MNRNKKTLYWIIGIIIALIVIFLFWGMTRNKTDDPQGSLSGTMADQDKNGSGTENDTGIGADTGADIHAGMDHGTADSTGADNADSDHARYMQEETAIMDRMMRDMELKKDTGNAALDFLDGMIPHHEAAIAMAESYLNHGGDQEKLKPLAEDIITAQKSEITQMKDMLKRITDSGKTDLEAAGAYREAYQKMMTGHHDGHNPGDHMSGSGNTSGASGTIDTAFAEGMIMHHQMAVDMAKAILDNTDEQDVLTLARQIIDAQEEEISLMQEVLTDSTAHSNGH